MQAIDIDSDSSRLPRDGAVVWSRPSPCLAGAHSWSSASSVTALMPTACRTETMSFWSRVYMKRSGVLCTTVCIFPSIEFNSFLLQADATISVVKENDLYRTQNNKVYYGRWEVNIMLAALLRMSEYGAQRERLVKLQTSCLIVICFYMMARPGSLAPASEEHIHRKMIRSDAACFIYMLSFILTWSLVSPSW